MKQTSFRWTHKIATLLHRLSKWLAIIPSLVLVLVLVQVFMPTYAMAVQTAVLVQRL